MGNQSKKVCESQLPFTSWDQPSTTRSRVVEHLRHGLDADKPRANWGHFNKSQCREVEPGYLSKNNQKLSDAEKRANRFTWQIHQGRDIYWNKKKNQHSMKNNKFSSSKSREPVKSWVLDIWFVSGLVQKSQVRTHRPNGQQLVCFWMFGAPFSLPHANSAGGTDVCDWMFSFRSIRKELRKQVNRLKPDVKARTHQYTDQRSPET